MSQSPRWKHRPPGSNWGDFGPDDQLGRLNLLTSEKVLKGVAEVREGKRFCLSLPLDYPGGSVLTPCRAPPKLSPTYRDGRASMNYPLTFWNPHATDILSDDVVVLTLQYSTQWDSFAHLGQMFDADGDGKPELLYYNGYRAGIDVVGPVEYRDGQPIPLPDARPQGAYALGIENYAAAAIQGRGVLIDLEAHFDRKHTMVSFDDLKTIMEKDKVVVEHGDMLCLRTGYTQFILEHQKNLDPATIRKVCSFLDGRDEKLLQWITDTGIVAIMSDTSCVEFLPSRPGVGDSYTIQPLHEHCLFKLGIPLGELWHFAELADWLRANKRSRFLLTAPPLRLPGAVGSPVTPVATV